MADKRKPCFVFLLKSTSNVAQKRPWNKVEVYDGKLWKDCPRQNGSYRLRSPRYRLRVNGKWNDLKPGSNKWFTKAQVMALLSRSINF